MPVPEGKPVRVLFVCLGNICRSPMAEAIFRHLVEQAGLSKQIVADSAGTAEYHIGEPPHPGTQRVLREHGIAYEHAARTVTRDDLTRFDYLVALDSSNLSNLRRLAGGSNTHIELLLNYAPHSRIRDVPDPYYTGGFTEVYGLIEQGCRGLLEQIVREQGLVTNSTRIATD